MSVPVFGQPLPILSERQRSALLAWKIECAAFSLHNGESQIERTRAARIESRINGILEGQ